MKKKFNLSTSVLVSFDLIAKNEGITITKLEQVLGASKGVFSRALANGSDIQAKWVKKLVENYPQYNTEWILTGKGKMLKEKENKPVATLARHPGEGIPLIPFDAMAGVSNGDVSVMELDCERYVVPVFKGADFLIPVKGSSMYPKYSSGDIVACKKVPMEGLFFQWNKVYVLDTVQGPLIKRVAKGSTENTILAVSENPKYEPFELHLEQLRAVAIVMGVIRLE
jgi:phage repressor protein C with HTH and peptisase S24 domain